MQRNEVKCIQTVMLKIWQISKSGLCCCVCNRPGWTLELLTELTRSCTSKEVQSSNSQFRLSESDKSGTFRKEECTEVEEKEFFLYWKVKRHHPIKGQAVKWRTSQSLTQSCSSLTRKLNTTHGPLKEKNSSWPWSVGIGAVASTEHHTVVAISHCCHYIKVEISHYCHRSVVAIRPSYCKMYLLFMNCKVL